MGVIWFPSIHNFLKLKYSCASFTCKLRNNVMLFYKSNCKERESGQLQNMIRDRYKKHFYSCFLNFFSREKRISFSLGKTEKLTKHMSLRGPRLAM